MIYEVIESISFTHVCTQQNQMKRGELVNILGTFDDTLGKMYHIRIHQGFHLSKAHSKVIHSKKARISESLRVHKLFTVYPQGVFGEIRLSLLSQLPQILARTLRVLYCVCLKELVQ